MKASLQNEKFVKNFGFFPSTKKFKCRLCGCTSYSGLGGADGYSCDGCSVKFESVEKFSLPEIH